MSSENTYDIIVIGAGMAGIMAALAAKTPDNRVLIVEPSNVLGGQGTVGGVAGFCGDTERVNHHFSNLISQLQRYGFIHVYDPTADRREYDLEWCAYFLQEMVIEKQIEILFHSRVVGAKASNGRIENLTISTVGGIMEVACGFVVDASGQCIVPTLSGLPVIHEGANKQLPMSLYFTLWDTGKPVKPFLPPGAIVWDNDEAIPMTSLHIFSTGKVEVKMKVVGFDAADGFDRSKAEIHGRRYMMSLIYFLQTKGYAGTVLDRHVLASVSRSIGVREEKRIVGEYFLTEDEAKHGAVFEDAVAVGTYHFDYHWPDKMERAGTGITTMVEPYHIPLKCMIPKGAKNLLVAGRSASGDQLALSSFRVMATVAQMGFGAGHAARFCTRDNIELADINLVELQNTIETGGQSLNLSDYGEYLRQSLLTEEFVWESDVGFRFCQASSIVQLRNSRFLVTWYAGSGEGEDDTAIWIAERFRGLWSSPRIIAKVGQEAHWNPVLFYASGGETHLYFKVGPNPRQWTTWRMVSSDDGGSWSKPIPLENSANETAVGPVRSRPVFLGNGTLLAPNSFEDFELSSEACVDRSDDGGQKWEAIISSFTQAHLHEAPSIESSGAEDRVKGFRQPTLWESEAEKVHVLVSSSCGWLFRSDSEDGGMSWTPYYRTEISNNGSAFDVMKLNDGTLVLAFNPANENGGTNSPLSLSVSTDNGKSWRNRFDVATGDGEFTFPTLYPTQRGIALTYTWNHSCIAFWHGSIEQVINPELVKVRNSILHTGVVSLEA